MTGTDPVLTLIDESVEMGATKSDAAASLPGFMDPFTLLHYFGAWALVGLLVVILVESGILFPVLPGDSLLFVSGMLVASGGARGVDSFAALWQLLVLVPLVAVVGGQIGYWIGRYAGTTMFTEDSRILKKKHIDESRDFFDMHGPTTVVVARFVPVIQTLVPLVAGAGHMKYRVFVLYNVVGAVAWGCGITLLGYWLGQFSFMQGLIEPIFILIVTISILPVAWGAFTRRRSGRGLVEVDGATPGPASSDVVLPEVTD